MVFRWIVRGWIVTVTVVAFGLISSPTGINAQTNAITVIEQTTESRFGDSFIFRIRATSSAGEITYARVIYETRAQDTNTSRTLRNFVPASEVDLEYVWRTRFDTVPPWQIVYYRWELSDSAGNSLLTPRTRAEIRDDTRDWQRLSDSQVAVYWYDQPLSFGQELLSIAQRGYAHVVAATGYVPDDEMRIVMFNDQEAFCSFFEPGACQYWYAGVAFGNLTAQWLIPDRERFVMWQVVPHELAHAFLNDWLGKRITALPRWFNEGQAMNNELEGLAEELARAQEMGQRFQLTRLALMDQTVVQDRNSSLRVARWYSQSASLVAFLFDRWGLDSLGKIVNRVKAGQKFELALQEVTGLTFDEYELAWRAWLGATTPLPTFFPSPTFVPFPPTPTYEPTPVERR